MNQQNKHTPNLKEFQGKGHYKIKQANRGRGEGITYQNVCQYCNETRHLTRIRRANGVLFVCKKHAGEI